jgi:hypothetical protein
MNEQLFFVGQCVTTPHGFVAEITKLTSDCALVRYLGKQRHLGEMEMQLALLRPTTAHDLVHAGIHGGDPSAPKPWNPSAGVIEESGSRQQPHRDEHTGWRSKRNCSPANNRPGNGLHELVTSMMKESQ